MAWTDLLPQPQAPTPNIGANPNALLELQLNQLRLNEARQEVAGQNALRQAAGDQSNFQNGQFAPQGNALANIFRADPNKGLEVQNALSTIQERQNRNSLLSARVSEDEQTRLLTAVSPALDEYYKVKAQTGSEEQARKAGQDIYTKAIDDIKPTLRPETRNALLPNFDPQRLRASQMANPKIRAGLAEERKEKFEGYTKTEEMGPDGTPRTIYTAAGKPSLDMAGNPITPTGMPKPERAAEDPYMLKVRGDDGKTTEVLGRRAPGGRGFVNDETGDPVKNVVGARKVGTKDETDNNPTMDQETLHTNAEQYLAGDRTVMQNVGRGAQGSKNIVALRAEIAKLAAERGMSGADIAAKLAEYDGMKAGMRTLGTRTANIEMAVNEAQQLAPLVLDASNKVNRTQFPLLNQVLQAGEKGVGDEDVVRFGISVNSLINTYARAINPTGVSRVSDIEHARELLSTAWSKGQINAGVDQLMKEMDAARKSPGVVRGEMTGAIAGQKPLPGGAQPSQPGSQTSPAKGPMVPEAGGVYTLRPGSEQADFDSLPSGAQFRGPDGKLRTKP